MSILDTFDPSSPEIISASSVVHPVLNFPKVILAVFNPKFVKILTSRVHVTEISGDETGCQFPIYQFQYKNVPMGLCCVSLGGPGAAGALEELFALGAEKVLFFGSAGSLDRAMTPGHLIVPTAAYRDEGTSYHYLPSSDFVQVTTAAQTAAALEEIGVPYRLGRTWTTDAFYRETIRNMERRKADGCIVVEQECASVMAVGQLRGKNVYQFLYTADCLDGDGWDARILGHTPAGLREEILEIGLKVGAILGQSVS
jgi:uridine phosphorylase